MPCSVPGTCVKCVFYEIVIGLIGWWVNLWVSLRAAEICGVSYWMMGGGDATLRRNSVERNRVSTHT